MMDKLKTILSLIIIVICLPYLVTFVVQGDFLKEQESVNEGAADKDIERLILILANEMPTTYEKEALKAQAVIARTNLTYARENEQEEPKGVLWEELRDQLGAEKFQKCFELLKNCVEETAGEVVTYEDKVVQLPYHFVSAGKTRDASQLDGEDVMPYLKAVSSINDLRSERFLKVEFFTKKQFQNKLKSAYPKLDFSKENLEGLAKISRRDSSDYVLMVDLPGKKVSGEEFRKVFSLNSTCFSLKEVDDQVRIVTKGYGQGYGMSQYGANEMAKDGSSYREILEHYYHGIKIS